MPRKRYEKDLNDEELNAFVDGLNSRRDWRKYLAQADFSDYKIDQFLKHINENGLIEICTVRGTDMLCTRADLQEWLDKQAS